MRRLAQTAAALATTLQAPMRAWQGRRRAIADYRPGRPARVRAASVLRLPHSRKSQEHKVLYTRTLPLPTSYVQGRDLTVGLLKRTHVHVADVSAADREEVFTAMQGESWSPRGQARALIASLGLTHTSMSVGDVVRDPDYRYWQCLSDGWREVPYFPIRPPRRVVLILDDFDRHGVGCRCDSCNSAGRSFGVGVYDLQPDGEYGGAETLVRVYGPSPEAAEREATLIAVCEGWEVEAGR